MSIGVVIPTYNRRQNLVYVLQSLACQTCQDFHVVVADDGSTDGTRAMIEQLRQEAPWQGRLRWIGCGPNRSDRPGRARNIGAANLAEDCTFVIMLDSDVILNPEGIERYAQAHAQHPTAIIAGVIEWLPPLAYPDLSQLLQQGMDVLRSYVPSALPRHIEGTYVGPDVRGVDQYSSDTLRSIRPETAIGANVGYPQRVFWELEGFDEQMRGYGSDDVELGVRAHRKGISCLLHTGIWVLHIWHNKKGGDIERSRIESERNLDYVLRKHGPIANLESVCDWTYWGHYHRLRGGKVVAVDDKLWAINLKGTQRLFLPDIDWIERLGFCSMNDVEQKDSSEIAHIQIAGVCYNS